MLQYPTCSHIKEDGSFCGVAALRDRKYCYYHLMQRARRLRQARALRDCVPYRPDIQSLDNLYAIRNALTEVVQAVGAGQLDPLAAGKMLYGIQQVTSINRRIEKMEAAAAERAGAPQNEVGAGCPVQASDSELERGFSSPNSDTQDPQSLSIGNAGDQRARVEELPNLEKELYLAPGADLDAEIEATLLKADQQAELRSPEPMLIPPPGVRPGSAAYRVYREEAYQMLQMQVKSLRHDLRDYYEQKRQQSAKEIEKNKQEMLASDPSFGAKPQPEPTQPAVSPGSAPKKPSTSTITTLNKEAAKPA